MSGGAQFEAQQYVVNRLDEEVGSTAPGPVFLRWRIIEAESRKVVCENVSGGESVAKLLAAAPALVEALKDALAFGLADEEGAAALEGQMRAALRQAGVEP